MDPFTFGIVFVGATGAALTGIALLGNAGIKINEDALKIVMELAKYGSILYLLQEISKFL
ncbi:hypothetical protein [Bacillus mesophilum]|uniref:Uncharacterized protein n=1 Tax=Bacillus mesophilum TaxID=1071718 RepID=A0A7V7RNZ4_9BACI|nr:hypothetical protein [Bacillus mesophilum]KAB2334249.1 hypothetical protein F7732_09265 [Bacillus mesophilum]